MARLPPPRPRAGDPRIEGRHSLSTVRGARDSPTGLAFPELSERQKSVPAKVTSPAGVRVTSRVATSPSPHTPRSRLSFARENDERHRCPQRPARRGLRRGSRRPPIHGRPRPLHRRRLPRQHAPAQGSRGDGPPRGDAHGHPRGEGRRHRSGHDQLGGASSRARPAARLRAPEPFRRFPTLDASRHPRSFSAGLRV